MEQDMLDDEIGFIPETGTGSAKARRNKDDEPYRRRVEAAGPPNGRGRRRKWEGRKEKVTSERRSGRQWRC